MSPRVRAALMNRDLCHREPAFADLQDDIRARLLGVYGLAPEHYAAVLPFGSGSAAVEAMLTSLIPQTGELLVLENGVYGQRLTRITEARNGRYRHLLGIARDGLRALGIEPLFPCEDCSVVLNAFQLPRRIGYTELHDRLKDRGFIIYAGQGDLATTLFRVSAMGAIAVADMERFVDAVREAISG